MPGNTHPNTKWNEENDTTLRALWAEGKSANQIALTMGQNFTRNAVIGRANRLKLPPRVGNRAVSNAQRAAASGWKKANPRKNGHKKPVTLPPLPINRPDIVVDKPPRSEAFVVLPGAPEPIGMASLGEIGRPGKPGKCRWPIGENPTLFCGCATETSYCAEHAKRAFRPIEKKAKAKK